MKILVLQHERVEHPAAFRWLIEAAGHSWHPVHLNEGEPVPPVSDLDAYGALWVMGGPMDVWEEDQYSWLAPEKAFVKTAIDGGMPFFGLCFGHQILAEAMGGKCAPGTAEVGVMEVALTEDGVRSGFLEGMPQTLTTLQWHGAEVADPPPGATILASSPACAVQAMSVGPTAFSAQFHLEVEADTVDNWAAIPAYEAALVKSFGPGGVATLRADCAAHMSGFEASARQVWRNWCAAAGLAAGA
ncbi:MAG: type 1 glutamine amidotransferase [Pseudomonadota bacterium]